MSPTIEARVDAVLDLIRAEVGRAMLKHPAVTNSRHHHFAVLKEEVDELWDEVKRDGIPEGQKEAIQVGAMAVRFILETPSA